ncbi:META domain-containing protein [Caldilinea sp.]|uniref:META domain-containing protein n=1 Tax=Caldilinea sp. TaxID=2293560 RepID=UPI002B8206BB|nr:META domain-containing protein [Caldilinea sp.]HRA66705.1 META domain-containing protein [Caldilinea sp.]
MKNQSLRWLMLALVAALVFGSFPAAALAAPALQQAEPSSDVLTVDALSNMTYQSALAPDRAVTLVDGRYEGADDLLVVLADEPMAYGQLDGQDAAAVLIAENGGGSGAFVNLAIVLDQDGTPVNVASTLLGDRVDVYALAISDDMITVEMVRQGPNDPMCCPTEVVRITYTLDSDQSLQVDDVTVLGSGAQATLNVAPENGYQTTVMPATPYDITSLIPAGAPIHTLLTVGNDDAATVFAVGGPYIAVYPVQEYVQLWEAAGDNTIANLVANLESVLAEQPVTLTSPLPIAPPAAVNGLVGQVRYLSGEGYSGVRFVARATPTGALAADDQLAYYFSGLTDDGRYLIGAQWPVTLTVATAALDADALDAADDAQWTPALSSLDEIVASLSIQRATAVAPEALANMAYASMLLEQPVVLTNGVYTETIVPDSASGVITVWLLDEPMVFGTVEDLDAAAVLIVENGGGTGNFVSLHLVQDVGGEAVNTASALLGDRSRVTNLAINADGSITVDMIQVGPNDAFCCPNMPMTITFVKVGDQLVYQDQQSATIDATGAAEQVTAFVAPATAYDNTVPPSGLGEPKHFAWGIGEETDLQNAAGYVAVYPVAAYQSIWDEAGDPFVADALAQLETLLSERPANPAPPLPVLPQVGATNDFAAQVSYLDLPDGGAGVRFVGRFAQDVSPIENFQLRYLFQGLSGDGQFLMVASLPITTTALPTDPQSLDGDAYDAFVANYETYLAETTATFDALAAPNFTPDLAALDAMLLSVTPEATRNPLAPSALANMEVKSELASDGVALLENGVYTETVAPDSASVIEIQLLPSPMAYGTLDDQDAVAALLAENGGGSGTFVTLALIVDQDGAPVHVASAPLGDRVQVQSLAIADNQITVEMLTQGPDDPLCCPTQPVTQVYAFQDDTLVLVEETVGSASSALAGASWVWTQTQMNDGAVKSPAAEGDFTLTFGDDGTVVATTDCNTFIGSYTESADSGLAIEFVISTAMVCTDETQAQEFIADVTSINSYLITDEGVLALLLPYDSGSILFDRAVAAAATNDDAASEDAASDAPVAAEASPILAGTTWNWVQSQYGNDTVAAPAETADYVLMFGADGALTLQDDCNVVKGSYTEDARGALRIDLQTSTFAACAPDSQHDQFVLDLSNVASYLVQEGNLFIALKYDSGVMEFALAE